MSDSRDWVESDSPKCFERVRNKIEAIRVTEDALKTCAIWCGGEYDKSRNSTTRSYLSTNDEPALTIPTLSGPIHAFIGDWLIRDQDGRFSIMSSKEFREEFQQCKTNDQSAE